MSLVFVILPIFSNITIFRQETIKQFKEGDYFSHHMILNSSVDSQVPRNLTIYTCSNFSHNHSFLRCHHIDIGELSFKQTVYKQMITPETSTPTTAYIHHIFELNFSMNFKIPLHTLQPYGWLEVFVHQPSRSFSIFFSNYFPPKNCFFTPKSPKPIHNQSHVKELKLLHS